ncbi:MAG: hypothetical protein AABX25_04600 [Nanoarchaeota archaeon]
MSPLEIQLSQGVTKSGALQLIMKELGCKKSHNFNNYAAGDYIISVDQLFYTEEDFSNGRIAYQVGSRSTITSDSGPNQEHKSDFYSINVISGIPITRELGEKLKDGLTRLS